MHTGLQQKSPPKNDTTEQKRKGYILENLKTMYVRRPADNSVDKKGFQDEHIRIFAHTTRYTLSGSKELGKVEKFVNFFKNIDMK